MSDIIFRVVIGVLGVGFAAVIVIVAWMFGYEVATSEWCNHIGGEFVDSVCLVGDNLKAVRP